MRRRRGRLALALGGVGAVLLVVASLVGSFMVLGAGFGCEGSGAAIFPATRSARSEIPAARLRLYQEAGKRFDVDWAFLASIGYQECGHGACAHVYPSGCGGPMQIAIERESACSPGSGPTIWERYKVDADGNGANPFDPADAIFTAARMLRPVFGLAGNSYADYHEAACNYYGACADVSAAYAAEVMARAVRYGFGGAGAPGASGDESAAVSGGSCEGSTLPTGSGPMGPVHKASSPRHLATLPATLAVAGVECDARIVPDVVYIARRFGLLVTACYGTGHEPDGEHPLGAANRLRTQGWQLGPDPKSGGSCRLEILMRAVRGGSRLRPSAVPLHRLQRLSGSRRPGALPVRRQRSFAYLLADFSLAGGA